MNVVIFSPIPRPGWVINLTCTLRKQAARVSIVTYGHDNINKRAVLDYLLKKNPEVIIINTDVNEIDTNLYYQLEVERAVGPEDLVYELFLPQAFGLLNCLNSLSFFTKTSTGIICIGSQMAMDISIALEFWGANKRLLPSSPCLYDPLALINQAINEQRYAKELVGATNGVVDILDLDDFYGENEDEYEDEYL
jgi:hypothetical protein